MNARPACLALVLLAAAPVLGAAAPSTAASPVRAAVERAAPALPAGGIVLAEVVGNAVTYTAAGKPSPAPGVAPEQVVFEIGSITKVFTGLLLAQTVLEGKASLDDPIGPLLRHEVELDPATAAITLGQLATHTAGLPRMPTNFTPAEPADPYADYSTQRLIAFLRQHRSEKAPPQPTSYSNVGFGLLGELLARIHGKSYADLVAERITGPLGMVDTAIQLDDDERARFALPHSGALPVRPWRFGPLSGAGALRSTAADMVRFAGALLAESPGPLTQAWALAREPRAPAGGMGGHVGLGVFILERAGRTVYHHSGGTGGFRSYLELVPAAGSATVVLVSNDAIEPGNLVHAALAPAPAVPPAARPETPVDPAALADYVGVYAIDERARFTFVLDHDRRLRARLSGQPFLPAYHQGNDRFFLRAVAAEYQFTRDAGGRVSGVTLHQNGREIAARRLDEAPPPVLFPAPAVLAAYAGRYQLAPGLEFEVTPRPGHLVVKLTGQPALPVFCLREDHFAYDVVDAALTFERAAPGGAVTALVLHQNGRDQRAARLP